jgi:hypothetical protein
MNKSFVVDAMPDFAFLVLSSGLTSPRPVAVLQLSAFLAVLEMVRVGAVVLKHDKQCGAILVKRPLISKHASIRRFRSISGPNRSVARLGPPWNQLIIPAQPT